jgi:23S rRNA (cytosine1962-C5)-methyltransferase
MATLRLRISATAESIIRSGHPWLFADSVREQNREGKIGELAVIFDRNDSFLAVGLFDPDSPLRVRILHTGKPRTIDLEWWRTRLAQAVGRRGSLIDEHTNGCRLINGESDGWPGLVLDKYGATQVLKLYTGAWLPRLDAICSLIIHELKPERLVLRLSRNIQSTTRAIPDIRDGQLLHGRSNGNPVIFLESGLQFEADVVHGQKTGFFLDQRENRRRVESLARGRNVLNAFSHTGGFSVYAARGGARTACNLDISPLALSGSERNFKLNRNIRAVADCPHESIAADAFDWLENGPRRKFDLIVLDPPSLAKRETERSGAIQGYGRLAGSGLKRLDFGGILVAASCSAHVTTLEFFNGVLQAATRSRRPFREMSRTGQPEDHPATFAEAAYLKCIYLQFEP